MIPIFKSHYSLGRSILTLEDKADPDDYPDSIIQICKQNKLQELFLVEDNMSSFLEAYFKCKNNNIKLNYGIRLTVTEDMQVKTEDSRSKNSKIIIFAKNKDGYKKLIKIYTASAKDGFYYEPRTDYNYLKNIWDDTLLLCIPFYDSFIFNNTLKNNICVPQFIFTKPIFFIEDNELPFDDLIKNKVINFVNKNNFQYLNVKSIFYNSRKDFKAYLTFRCINNRSVLNKPELEHMSSPEFCFESYLEKA